MQLILAVSSIRTDGGTQPRASIDFDAVDDYMDDMQAGVTFPPITVFYDGTDYWLADGFHRTRAAFAAELSEIVCDVHQGTREDAQWYSFAANKTNGLRRTNEDKQRAVKAALAHPSGAGKSDSAIAKHVGVDSQTVANWRAKLTATSEIRKSATRTGSDGRTINTANIGRKPVEIRQPESRQAPEHRVASKRQQLIEGANKRRMIDGITTIRGNCRGLAGMNSAAAINALTAEEARAFAGIAGECLQDLRKLRMKLIERCDGETLRGAMTKANRKPAAKGE